MAKWFVLFLLCFASVLQASPSFLDEHEEGWYWHKEKVEVDKKIKQEAPVKASPNRQADPDQVWKQIGKTIERARAKAILNPTPGNIAEARRLQRMVVAQSSLFSEQWMLDLLRNPDQDESLVNPSNSAARDLYNQHNSELKEKAIAELSASSGLVYFYEGGEPFSERMAEVVRDFASHYQISVIPIAMNGKISASFPDSRTDSGMAVQMGVKHIPAVFTIHPVSKQSLPLAYGLISQTELKENILLLSQSFQSGEKYEK